MNIHATYLPGHHPATATRLTERQVVEVTEEQVPA